MIPCDGCKLFQESIILLPLTWWSIVGPHHNVAFVAFSPSIYRDALHMAILTLSAAYVLVRGQLQILLFGTQTGHRL